METEFRAAYARLNQQQKRAVDTIEGALLVLAGPGTGKTQLLSTRAAKIVSAGAVSASNILCLTYTETGASEMRQRLTRIMGNAGGEVAVHTFHSFGSWLINQYPEQFSAERSLQPLDDLTRYGIVTGILKKLPFRHQLAIRDEHERFIRQHAVEEAIRAFKQAGLTPAAVRKQLTANQAEYQALQPMLDELFASNLTAKRLDDIAALVQEYRSKLGKGSYGSVLLQSLQVSIDDSQAAGKTATLGKWRDAHTVIKDQRRVLKSAAQNQLLNEVVDIYERYQKQLTKQGRYDYEDMVLWAADALDHKTDVQLDVAERFQYIMVDEYQDTNGAQNRLLDNLLQAHPLDSPNVMVVGDDDQAIMRFQGAEVSGMLQFAKTYQPQVIALKDNYRSGQLILDASRQIMTQTDERLEVSLPELQLSKQLNAQARRPKATITHQQYSSPTAEYGDVAQQIEQLIQQGVAPSQIGVIGRKHAELVTFAPYLTTRGITINYDRREDILQQNHVVQLLALARYVATLAQKPQQAQPMLPTVLAGKYWHIDPLALYELAAKAKIEKLGWIDTMLQAEGEWPNIAEWLLGAAQASQTQNFTQMLDILLGRQPLANTKLKISPFANSYVNQAPETYLTILSHLLCLREAVLQNQPQARGLNDLLTVADQYTQSGLRLIDDNPILRGDSDSVHVMSAHGAKGREFEHVFILSTVDEVWGNRARSHNQRIFLPENLPLYPAGDAESDKLRLLYVAMTRTKSHLHISSYVQTDAGKAATPLSFLALGEDMKGWWQPQTVALGEPTKVAALEASWLPTDTTSRTLQQTLEPALKNWHLSATALRDFLDIRYSRPQAAIEKHVLKFPSAYNASSALGNATHRILQAAHAAWQAGKPLDNKVMLKQFDEALESSGLAEHELSAAREHGHLFLVDFVHGFSASDFDAITTTEQFLKAVSPTLNVPLSGAIDALAKEDDFHLRVIDYKTGSPPTHGWQTKGLTESKKASLYFYKQQLLFYKLLVDNSPAYYGKQIVSKTQLVFAEKSEANPDQIIRLDITDFAAEELERIERLMHIVYNHIVAADLPDTSQYSKDLKGIQAFEADLLSNKI